MEKISKYAICLPLEDDENQYVYINGCYGDFQIVPPKIGEIICKGTAAEGEVGEYLRSIHYLIPAEADEEQFIRQTYEKVRATEQAYFNFTFVPSYRCNFHCPYCFEKDISQKNPHWMSTTLRKEQVDASFAFAERLINEGKHFYNIRLFGGEPLLPKHREIVEYIGQKSQAYDVPIQTITNGYYTDQFSDLFEKYRFEEFKITIDGTAKIHDERRAPADTHKSFHRILSNVAMLLKQGKKVTLRTNVNRENIEEIPKLIQLYQELDFAENPNFHYYFKSTISCFEKPENAVSDGEIMGMIGNTTSNYCRNSTYFRIFKQIKALLGGNPCAYTRPTYCGASCGNYMFDPNGNVFSCLDIVTEPRSVIGQLEQQSVMLNGQAELWQSRTFETVATCKNCRYKMFCGGGCAAQALVVNEDMDSAVCDGFIENFNQVAVTVAKEMTDKK